MTATMRHAGKEPVFAEEALAMLDGMTELWVAKGRSFVRIDLAQAKPPEDELLALMLGRTGKLRAPTVNYGQRLLVGFNQEMHELALNESP